MRWTILSLVALLLVAGTSAHAQTTQLGSNFSINGDFAHVVVSIPRQSRGL